MHDDEPRAKCHAALMVMALATAAMLPLAASRTRAAEPQPAPQTSPQSSPRSETPPQPVVITAAQVAPDIIRLGGQWVQITDGEVLFASPRGALLNGGPHVFLELHEMTPEAIAVLVPNCAGPQLGRKGCKVRLIGQLRPDISETTGWPVLRLARIVP